MWTNFMLFICHINVIELAFVSIGNYPDYKQFDVNLNECGLRYVPRHTLTLHYSSKCFHNRYEKIIFLDYSEPRKSKSNKLNSERIYKGEDVEFGESPWTVYISIQKSGKEVNACTGSLITFEWVVTAAHCLEQNIFYSYDQLLVSGGTNKPMKGQIIEANIRKIVINANYTSDKHYDIAVIKLMSKFTRHKNDGRNYLVNTICLPEIRENNENDENVTVFGYGFINPQSRATHLQTADMILSSNLTNYILITYTPGDSPTTCRGDSGGPLVQYLDNKKNRAVLVATLKGGDGRGYHCTHGVEYNRFVPVFNNIDWILLAILNN